MIQIATHSTAIEITQEDFQELIDMAEEGKAMSRQYDLSNSLVPLPDPQADEAREALLAKCKTLLEDEE